MTIRAKATIEVDGQIVLKRFSHDADQAKYDAIIRNREHLLPWLPWAHFYKEFKEMPEFTESQIKCFGRLYPLLRGRQKYRNRLLAR